MKDLRVYYFFSFTLPLVILIAMYFTNSSTAFYMTILIFAFYKNSIDTIRLLEKGVLKKSDNGFYLPFKSIRYFKELYFN